MRSFFASHLARSLPIGFEDARYSPETMLRRLAEKVTAGEIKVRRCVVVIENDDENWSLSIHGSGWLEGDSGPAVALLEAAKIAPLVGDRE